VIPRALLLRLFLQLRFLRDGEHLADGVIEALGFGAAGNVVLVAASYWLHHTRLLAPYIIHQ
jgi:hypothetical protein